MKNVTITLDEKTASWARVYAAQRNMSMSRLIGEMLAQRMQERSDYEHAMRTYLSLPPIMFEKSGKGYPSREELHDRAGLR